MEAARGVVITFEVTRVYPAFDGRNMNTSHMRAGARLTGGGWAGIRTGFVQVAEANERMYSYRSADGARTVTRTRRLPPNTLDGVSGRSPFDRYYSEGGFTDQGADTSIDDTPADDPPLQVMHSNGTDTCYLHTVRMHERFKLMYISEENGQFRLWWEGRWGHDLTATVQMREEPGKFRPLRKFSQGSLSGSIIKSMGPVVTDFRTVAIPVGGLLATDYTTDIDVYTFT